MKTAPHPLHVKHGPRFYTRAGRLTPYSLACGYIEQYERNGKQVTLWLEHAALHVRAHDFNTGKRLFWDCPETLTAARRRFDRAKRAIATGAADI